MLLLSLLWLYAALLQQSLLNVISANINYVKKNATEVMTDVN